MSSTRKAWIAYTVLRLLFFAVPFGVVYAIGLSLGFSIRLAGVIGVVFAALIGVSLSVIFLSRLRSAASTSIFEARARHQAGEDEPGEDETVEDTAVDSGMAPATTGSEAVDPAPSEPGRGGRGPQTEP